MNETGNAVCVWAFTNRRHMNRNYDETETYPTASRRPVTMKRRLTVYFYYETKTLDYETKIYPMQNEDPDLKYETKTYT